MFALFLSSYMPLFFLVGLRSIDGSDGITIGCGVLVLAGAAGTTLFLSTATKKSRGRYRIIDVQKRDGDVAAYAATYLLPFVTVFSDDWRDILSLAAFVVFLGVLYVRSRLIYVNPLLAIFGYHLWQVIAVTAGSDPDPDRPQWPQYLLARRADLYGEQEVSAYRVLDDLLLDAGESNR
jgi:hypothetical protein